MTAPHPSEPATPEREMHRRVHYAGHPAKLDSMSVLLCPCGTDTNLHHSGVEVFERGIGGANLRVKVKGPNKSEWSSCSPTVKVETGGPMVDNPSEERNGVLIRFWCELCPAKPRLAIYQHEGFTVMQWVPERA